jgi:hypothetical protein
LKVPFIEEAATFQSLIDSYCYYHPPGYSYHNLSHLPLPTSPATTPYRTIPYQNNQPHFTRTHLTHPPTLVITYTHLLHLPSLKGTGLDFWT